MNKQGRFSLALCVGLLAAVLFLLGTSAQAQSGVVYVAPGGLCGGAAPCYAAIQDAVIAAREGDTIKVAEGVYTRAGYQVVYLNKGISVIGGFTTTDWENSLPETRPTVVDAEGVVSRRGIQVEVDGDVPVRLEGLVVQRGSSGPGVDGGGIYVVAGTVTIHKCTIMGNSATGTVGGGGGGVFLKTGDLTISDSTIMNNQATRSGGGVAARGGTLLVTGSLVENNTSTDNGGGLFVNGADATLQGNTIRGNSPMGVFVVAGTVLLEGNTIEGNTSTGNGGGIGVNGPYPTIVTARNNLIQNNTAASGAGVGITAGTTTLYNNDIYSNTATANGGGVAAWANASQITLVRNRVTHNTGGGQGGGGLYVGDGNLTLDRNAIMHNLAPGTFGGALVVAGGHVVGINDVIADNSSMSEGVYVSGGTLVARHWTLAGNGDFALTANGGDASLSNTIVSSHTLAGFWGAGVVADHTLFYKNGTRCGNGAVCNNYITGSPAFVDAEGGDYHIGAQSLAIDAGFDVGIRRDMDYQPRMGTPDLGADEYWAPGTFKAVYLPLVLQP